MLSWRDMHSKIVVMGFARCHVSTHDGAEGAENPTRDAHHVHLLKALSICLLRVNVNRIKHLAEQLVQAKPLWSNKP